MRPGCGPGDWPAWAAEPVVIVDYDQGWALQAAQERQRLRNLLGPWLVDDIHHVGSTAIPGLPAKPIIEGVRDARCGSEQVAQLGSDLGGVAVLSLVGSEWG
jgi:GrpB protein